MCHEQASEAHTSKLGAAGIEGKQDKGETSKEVTRKADYQKPNCKKKLSEKGSQALPQLIYNNLATRGEMSCSLAADQSAQTSSR